jgi:hypothetical protein
MNTNTIVQFECFETAIALDDFVPAWEYYAKQLVNNDVEVTLHQQISGNSKFRYISRHVWPQDNFQFNFMKGRHSDFFSEGGVRVVQAGGYTTVQSEHIHDESNAYRKLLLFLPVSDYDVQEYKELSYHNYLNIYQSYFENCLYGYILEFYTDSIQMPHLMHWLKANKPTILNGLYKECLVLHV